MRVERIEMQVLSFPEKFKKLDDPKGEVLAEVKAAFPRVEERVAFVGLDEGMDAIFVWNGCVYHKHINFNEAVDYVSIRSKEDSIIEAERREVIREASS